MISMTDANNGMKYVACYNLEQCMESLGLKISLNIQTAHRPFWAFILCIHTEKLSFLQEKVLHDLPLL